MALVACIRCRSPFLTFNPPRLKKNGSAGDDFHFSKPASSGSSNSPACFRVETDASAALISFRLGPSGGETRKRGGRGRGKVERRKTEARGLTLHQNSPICSPVYGNMSLSNSAINKDNIYKRACQTPSGLSSAP